MSQDAGSNSTPAPKPRHLRRALIIAAIIAAAIFTWEEVLEDRLIAKRWGTVVEGSMYRSGQLHQSLIQRKLEEHDIDLVVCLRAHESDEASHVAELEAAAALQVEHVVFPLVGDGTGDVQVYAEAVNALVEAERAGRRSLVHCAAGTYRTGGVVAVYRMLVQGRSPEEARAEMIRYNWEADNPILPDYLNANMAELAERLVELGAIDAVPEPLPQLE